MKETFRQSMAWLHTWAGLLFSWVLFFVFVTGTFGYLNTELDRWMKPEAPRIAAEASAPELVGKAERWLAREHGDAQSWFVNLPGGKHGAEHRVGWRQWPEIGPEGEARFGKLMRQTFDPENGAPFEG